MATLIYRLLRWGQPYMDEGVEAYEKRYRQQRVKSLVAKAIDTIDRIVEKIVTEGN